MIDWNSMQSKVITVISDIHSNKRALNAVFDFINNNRSDQIIILGDILTYGIDVKETIDMINNAIDKGALLLMGNHDQIYLNLINGVDLLYQRLRPDLQESIDYNIKLLDTNLYSQWNWKQQIIDNNILYSHANPYGNVWEYIKDIYDYKAAATFVKKRNYLAGVFGHTHRRNFFSHKLNDIASIDGLEDDTFVLNPGSVGQPRGALKEASILRLSSHNNRLWAELEAINYDVQSHIDDLRKSSLSDQTKNILISHFIKE